MYGLYRSQLQCPTCSKISITFDPYLMVNVAIPQDNRKVLKVNLVNPECVWDHQEEVFHYDKSLNLKIKDVIAEKG
jgi:ubiquitin carboxyl-terminal hydrolase 4/11